MVRTRNDKAAWQETYVAEATGAAGCPVRCCWRRGQPCPNNASVETEIPFQTLGDNPCARAVVNASVCEMGGWVKIWNVAQEYGRERRGGSRSSWRMAWKSRGRCATGGEQWELEDGIALWIGSMRDRE